MGACCCCCAGGKSEHPSLGSPLQKRRCTDVHCLIVFFLYWAGMIGILVYTILFGRVQRLLNGFDDYGNTCGVKNYDHTFVNITYANQDMTDRPYQFFMNYYNLEKSWTVCVKKCPSRSLASYKDVADFYNESALCDYSISKESVSKVKECSLSPLGCFGPCPALEVPVEEAIFSRCLPSGLIRDPLNFALNKTIANDIVKFLGQYRFFNELASSFFIVKYDLLILMGVALGLSLLLVFLMRFVIKIVVWFIVVVAALAAIAGCVVLWITWYKLYKGIDPQIEHRLPFVGIAVDAKNAFLGYSITATVLTVILLLVILVMRKRLQLAVALFQEAGKVLENSPCVLIQPLWTYLFQIVVLALGVIMLILCAGVTDAKQDVKDGRDVMKFVDRSEVTYFWWYIVIGIVWMSEFAIAIQELIIAGTVAEWYFSRDKKGLSCTICSATSRVLIYHLGSAAFGAFLITLIKIPRYIMMKLHEKLDSSKTNECAKFMLKCCICCFYCLEKCMKFINRNAYIVIAISSTDFCKARVKAFNVLLSNVLRVVAINTVGDFVLFLGKVLVLAGTVVCAYFLFDRHNQGVEFGQRNFFFLPMLAIAIFSYFVAHCFLSSFEMLVDTLLLCFCEDSKVNDGSEEKPYFMSKSLMKFVANSSKAINNEKKKGNSDEATESERMIMAAGDQSRAVSTENVHLTK